MTSAQDIANAVFGVIGGNDEESTVRQFLDTGIPELNFAMSSRWDGGFPVGRIVEVAGPPSAGKTAIATVAMAAAQKAGGIAGFSDHERSFAMTLAPMLGLDMTPGRFIFKKPTTFEDSLTLCSKAVKIIREKKLIADSAPVCWVFDSLAYMVPNSARYDKDGNEKEAGDRSMHDNTALARATSAHFPAFAQFIEDYGVCAIFLNQIRMKLGVMFGDPRTTPGGEAPKFAASLRIMLGAAKITKGKGEESEALGQLVTATCIKNKVTRPFQKAQWRFMFEPDGTGRIDVESATIDVLERQGVLKTAGAGFVTWNGKRIGKKALAQDIRDRNAMDELKALLPSNFKPEIVTEADMAMPDTPIEEAA